MIDMETRNKVAKCYEEGCSYKEISKTFNISKSSIRNILKEKNMLNKRKSIPEEEVKRIYNRIKNGELARSIAKEKFVTESAISHLLKRRGYRR